MGAPSGRRVRRLIASGIVPRSSVAADQIPDVGIYITREEEYLCFIAGAGVCYSEYYTCVYYDL